MPVILAAALSAFLSVSCAKEDSGAKEEARFRENYEIVVSDYRADGGLLLPVPENISRSGKWGYDALVRIYKGSTMFALASCGGEIIHTSDGIIYGLSCDSIKILLDDIFTISGSNGNIVEYLYLLAALGRSSDRNTLDAGLAMLNSMCSLEVSYSGEDSPCGEIVLISVERSGLWAPAYAVRLSGSGALVELKDVPLDRISGLAYRLGKVLEVFQ